MEMNKPQAPDVCKQEPGVFIPVINRNKCEGKKDCVAVCPYDVFKIDTLPKSERSALSFIGKLKGFGHGWQQAFAVKGEACRACGLCVERCPEKAITLRRA